MIGGRVLLGSLLAGVGGALVIAAVVLGRGGQAEVVTWGTLQREGGVLHMRVENYEREPFERVFNPRPEWRIVERWDRFGEGGGWITAAHSADGTLLFRARKVHGELEMETEFVSETEPRDWPRVSGHSPGRPGLSCGEPAAENVVQIARPREGTVMCIEPYPRPATGSVSSAYEPAWPIDLDVVAVQKEVVGGERLQSIQFRAILEDGSRVLIASQRYYYALLPLSEWEGIEELVWGD